MNENTKMIKTAESYLGDGGSTFNRYYGLPVSTFWCNTFVCFVFEELGLQNLYYGGKLCTYCPNSIKWCRANLAQLPLYLAMPGDVIYFDWNGNGDPDHIGFVRARRSTTEIETVEGNTSGGKVDNKLRPKKYVLGIYRPLYKASYKLGTIKVDGKFGYSSIANLQKALGIEVNGQMSKATVKALQRKVGVAEDGDWGVKTSKAVQKMVGAKVDGSFGEESVKALQTWINKQNEPKTEAPKPIITPTVQATASATKKYRNLKVDGHGGEKTIKALQNFLGAKEDGVISGQDKDNKEFVSSVSAIKYGKGGSSTVKKMQKWLGITEDGSWGKGTSKALQKKIGATADGHFGEKSMKKLQKYLNEHDKAVYPTPKPTPTPQPTPTSGATKIAQKAQALAWAKGTKKSKYAYKGGSATSNFKTALDKFYPKHKSWGAGAKTGASCDVYVGTVARSSGIDSKYPRGFDEQIKYKSDKFTRKVYKNVKPIDVVKSGDIVLYTKNKSGSKHHTLIYADKLIYEAQHKKTYGHVNKSLSKLKTKRPKVVILRAK